MVTSSWRERQSYEDIGCRLREFGFEGMVRGATPLMPGATRGAEVRAYLHSVSDDITMVIVVPQAI